MLGRLLHLGTGGQAGTVTQTQGASSQPVSSLESVHEDLVTRNLLFPDTQALYQQRNDQVSSFATPATSQYSTSSHPFDYNDDVDLDLRDVRVLIMQDTLGPTHTSLLFDSVSPPASPSSPSPETQTSAQDSRKNPLSPRKSSFSYSSRPLVIQSGSPQQRKGAFDRRASVHSRSHSHAETDSQRAAREYREELAVFSSCIFGNSELMAYKGTSTKVHVVPVDSRTPENTSALGDGRGSIGRSSARSSKLSQSFSSQNVSPTSNAPFSGTMPPRSSSEKKKVLITRLFPVNLNSDDQDSTTPQSRFSDENGGYPFPGSHDDPTAKKKNPQPKQRRTPMYAIVLVVQLPVSASKSQAATPARSTGRESSSYTDQDFMPSSYNSTRFSGWPTSGLGTYGEGTESTYSFDVEDRIDALTQHWDIIMRTLSHLQSVVASTVHALLKQVDVASPGPVPPSVSSGTSQRASSFSERRSGEYPRIKPSKGTTKLVSLWPNCLAEDATIAQEADLARSRIVRGLCAERVVTGQGRWGIWRDETIWSSRWAASQNRMQFLPSLFTGFLSTHTDWLQALAPPSHQKRVLMRRHNKNEEDLALPARTIIVSDDKMLARRLIFLLTAFLPASQQVPTARAHRPSTSLGFLSQSPPSVVAPLLREESLRRKINRRPGNRRASHSRAVSQSARATMIPAQLAHLSTERSHERRASDAASVRATTRIVASGGDLSRKSSAATTTTIVPEATLPHFSTVQQGDNRRRPRPESSSSVAADDLKRSLQRAESSGHGSGATITEARPQNGTRWGSLIGGLWSQRRRESIDRGSGSQDGRFRSSSNGGRLAEMVREVSIAAERGDSTSNEEAVESPIAREFSTPRESISHEQARLPSTDRTPDPTGAFESPVKTSINANDGVIDVDVPFPEYMATFESPFSSPSSSGYLSTPGLAGVPESFENSGRIISEGDVPQNAAGWLDRYHPDFALQAIPPQDDLLDQVKASLRAEPTPMTAYTPDKDMSERWVDVGSALIIDARGGVVSRLTYRRLVKPRATDSKLFHSGTSVPSYHGSALLTPSVMPYEAPLEEEWIEEPNIGADEAITDAVERVITLNSDLSKDSSSASSLSRGGEWDKLQSRAAMAAGDATETTAATSGMQLAPTSNEIPRIQCKGIVLSALEDTIRHVIDKSEEQKAGRGGAGNAAARSSSVDQYRRHTLRRAVRDWLVSSETGE